MRPVVICGSQRFKEELAGFLNFLKDKGVFVLAPNFRYHKKNFIAKEEVKRLTAKGYKNRVPGLVMAHFAQISQVHSMGGVCLIFNPIKRGQQAPHQGYIGSNTQAEIGYACAKQMPIILLRPHEEEWINAVAHSNSDKNRIFSLAHPKADPLDYELVYQWLLRWLN